MSLSREDMRVYITEYRNNLKKKAIDFLGGQCAICGSTEQLEIDHKNREDKSFALSRNWTRAWYKTVAELTKCQLLCVSCHMKKSIKESTIRECGTVSKYVTESCRCDKCKKAYSEYNKNRKIEITNRKKK